MAGSYGHGNTGDEAILAAIVAQLRTRLPDVHLSVVAGDTQTVRARHSVEAISWTNWAEIASTVAGADLVILGGGGLFFDYWGFDPTRLLENAAPDLAHFASFPLLAWLYERPFMVWACGVGPLLTQQGREMVQLTFTSSGRSTVRDTESKALLTEIGVPEHMVRVTADPAFTLAPAETQVARDHLAAAGVYEGRPLLGIAPRPWDLSGPQEHWEARLTDSVVRLAVAQNAQVLVIPFHQGFDEPSCDRLAVAIGKRLPGRAHTLSGCLPPEVIAAVVGCCDLLIGVRLHSLLFALLNGTPAVALAYDPKVRQLMRSAGHEELCVDLSDLGLLDEALASAWTRRGELRREAGAVSAKHRAAAEENADLAVALIAEQEADNSSPQRNWGDFAFRRLAVRAMEGRLAESSSRATEPHERLRRLQAEVGRLKLLNDQLQTQLDSSVADLQTIHSGRAWRLMSYYWSLQRSLKSAWSRKR